MRKFKRISPGIYQKQISDNMSLYDELKAYRETKALDAELNMDKVRKQQKKEAE